MWIKITRLEEQKEQKEQRYVEIRLPQLSRKCEAEIPFENPWTMNNIHLGREKKIRIGYGSIPIDTCLVGYSHPF